MGINSKDDGAEIILDGKKYTRVSLDTDPRDPEGEIFARGAKSPQAVSESNASRTTPESTHVPIIDPTTGKMVVENSRPVMTPRIVGGGFRGKR